MSDEKPPKVTSLFDHPGFNPDLNLLEERENPMKEVDIPLGTSDLLGVVGQIGPSPPKAVCDDCRHVRKTRTKLFRKLIYRTLRPSMDWICQASPREKVFNPQTGMIGYLEKPKNDGGRQLPDSFGSSQPYEDCYKVNENGECDKYEKKATKRWWRVV